jgi:ankyrin repeat protein
MRTVELLWWFLAPERYPGWYGSWQQMYHHDIQHYCQGRPPLHYAIGFKIPSLIELLLPKGREVDSLHHGMAALHEAAKWGDIANCTTLLDRGASVKLKSSSETRSMTALHFAAEGGHSHVIQLLLARGADPHTRSRSQATPFYRAARSGSLDALRILYAVGSDINARTWDNWTPLFEAVAGGQVHIANQLLEWGADPTITTLSGENVLMLISQAMDNDQSSNESHDDMSVDLDPEPESSSGAREARKEREAMILLEIQKLQAETPANSTGKTFNKYLVNIVPGYFKLQSIEFDTRPGIERDKSRIWIEDVSG